MEILTVACVLKSGGIYTSEWVAKLERMADRNLQGVPYRFVCLTDIFLGLPNVEAIPLDHNLPGWWSKMELFRLQNRYSSEWTLYLDLDVLLMQNLWPLVEFTSRFTNGMALGHHFNLPPKPKREAMQKDGYRHGYNSSVMVFNRARAASIWSRFNSKSSWWMDVLRGDQDFLQECFPNLDTFPSKWIIKLGGCIKNDGIDIPPTAKVVLCMPHKNIHMAARYPLVREIWK